MKPSGKHAGASSKVTASAVAPLASKEQSATSNLLKEMYVGFTPKRSGNTAIGTIRQEGGPTAKVYEQDGILTLAVAGESTAINLDDYDGDESKVREAVNKSYERVSALLGRDKAGRIARDMAMVNKSVNADFGPGEAESIFLVAVSRQADGTHFEGGHVTSSTIFNNLANNPATPGYLLHQMATGEGMGSEEEWKTLGRSVNDAIIKNPGVEYRTLQRIKDSGLPHSESDVLEQKLKELKPKGFLRRLFDRS